MFLSILLVFVLIRSFFIFVFAWRNYTTTERRPAQFAAHLVFSSADVLIVFWGIAYLVQEWY